MFQGEILSSRSWYSLSSALFLSIKIIPPHCTKFALLCQIFVGHPIQNWKISRFEVAFSRVARPRTFLRSPTFLFVSNNFNTCARWNVLFSFLYVKTEEKINKNVILPLPICPHFGAKKLTKLNPNCLFF